MTKPTLLALCATLTLAGLAAAIVQSGCTKRNPDACCTSPADCTAVALPTTATCAGGEACQDHQCVMPTCAGPADCTGALPACVDGLCRACDATSGCTVATPLCNTVSYTCEGCKDATDCTAYPATPQCAPSGACVQCATASQCGAATPVCDHNACRVCVTDSECDSGACGLDGQCVAADQIVYVAPTGTDAGSCPQIAPCKTLGFASAKVIPTRSHLVLTAGSYLGPLSLRNIPQETVHGTGATVIGGNTGIEIFAIANSYRIVGVTFMGGGDLEEVNCVSPATMTFERTNFIGQAANTVLRVACDMILKGVVIRGNTGAGRPTSSVELVQGSLNATNLVITGNAPAIVVNGGISNIGFASIAGAEVDCNGGALTIHDSILWLWPSSAAVTGSSCTFVNSIVRGSTAPGTRDVDPLFTDPLIGDIHLKAGSPARDAADTGPPIDYEGDPRPRGAKFDLGADEAP